ncbi:high frequency lysogenization protein HflD [Aliidiomarina shirensis]|nr:high frequency lysogenization protein HflD [Aliidiomarina shirensis]
MSNVIALRSEFNEWHERMLAFGGLCLAAVCAQQLARRGEIIPNDHTEVLISSLLNLDPSSTLDVYGDLESLKPALRLLLGQLNGKGAKDVEQTRYVVGMLALERKLNASSVALDKLGSSLKQIKRQREDFDFETSIIVENLGKLYMDVISPLGPRIQISGKPEYLKQPAVQYQIRTMLLAGIRSAVLWRQLGGKRRHIILSRSKLVRAIEDLLRM